MATTGKTSSGSDPREASGRHQGLFRPDDDQHAKQQLQDASLDDLGEATEDELRDRRGSGIPAVDDVRSDLADDERSERR